jgi:fatty-acid desaturase
LLWGYLLFGLVTPGLLGSYLDGSFLLGALWIGFVGRFLSWHCIWTINSLSHWEGIREFSRASSAVYVAVVNFVQNGEVRGEETKHAQFKQACDRPTASPICLAS